MLNTIIYRNNKLFILYYSIYGNIYDMMGIIENILCIIPRYNINYSHMSYYMIDILYMVWYGMVWYGMVWYGMVWYGMV